MIVGGQFSPPSMNELVAGMYGNPQSAAASQALRVADASVRSQAVKQAAGGGAGATTSVQYQYTVGPDGQLYATEATVSTSKRTQGLRDTLTPLDQQDAAVGQPIAMKPAKPQSFADVLGAQVNLSSSGFAQIYGSEDFLQDTLNSNEAHHRARLQVADFGVRAQEGQHFRAAFGLGSAPEYDYEVGPDGELYAVAGSVGISTGAASSNEDAAADAATVARAALAATDVSAQDVSVARNAQAKAASLYAANHQLAPMGDMKPPQSETGFFPLVA